MRLDSETDKICKMAQIITEESLNGDKINESDPIDFVISVEDIDESR